MNEREMFGMTEADMAEDLRRRVKWEAAWGMRRAGESADAAREVVAFSMLSDAQELVAMGRAEEARKALNHVKWILGAPEAIAAAAGAFAHLKSGGVPPRYPSNGWDRQRSPLARGDA